MNLFKRMISFSMILVLLFSLSACNNGKSKQKYTKTYLDYFDTATTVIGYADNEDEFLTIANLVFGRLSEYHKLYENQFAGIAT